MFIRDRYSNFTRLDAINDMWGKSHLHDSMSLSILVRRCAFWLAHALQRSISGILRGYVDDLYVSWSAKLSFNYIQWFWQIEIISCNAMFDSNLGITLFCSFSFFFCCQTSYARVIMDRSRPTRVAKKIPPSDCRVIPLESSVMGHVWRYLLFQYVANTKNTKLTM